MFQLLLVQKHYCSAREPKTIQFSLPNLQLLSLTRYCSSYNSCWQLLLSCTVAKLIVFPNVFWNIECCIWAGLCLRILLLTLCGNTLHGMMWEWQNKRKAEGKVAAKMWGTWYWVWCLVRGWSMVCRISGRQRWELCESIYKVAWTSLWWRTV